MEVYDSIMFRDPVANPAVLYDRPHYAHITRGNYWKNDICITPIPRQVLTPIFTPVYRGLVDELTRVYCWSRNCIRR